MTQTAHPRVGILMGSESDWPAMKGCVELLGEFAVDCEVNILSAHRTPDDTAAYAKAASQRGVQVIIAAAGMAAHLAGTVAAQTSLPVIGVPMAAGQLQGIDALLSTVQMPPGVPVACVGIGPAGAKNAALLAVQILALSDAELAGKLQRHKADLARGAQEKNRTLAEKMKRE
ncbi:MAG: 5-(carboxyamino)imidazole ribonucleotide mutase [Sedimentisphaerales bacterium]|nr:5-(carboxyamino)imidazole ribonucleotide mutase [Sedimentisphaerales bacterium]